MFIFNAGRKASDSSVWWVEWGKLQWIKFFPGGKYAWGNGYGGEYAWAQLTWSSFSLTSLNNSLVWTDILVVTESPFLSTVFYRNFHESCLKWIWRHYPLMQWRTKLFFSFSPGVTVSHLMKYILLDLNYAKWDKFWKAHFACRSGNVDGLYS